MPFSTALACEKGAPVQKKGKSFGEYKTEEKEECEKNFLNLIIVSSFSSPTQGSI